MSITVAECLQLPSLREATVVAGHKGLDKYVSTVSVLEYARVFAMAEALFLGNELIISAFISVMDDVDAQCNAVRRLHEVGESGLILYYTDYYLKNIDKRLIATANELDFPLIIMPPNAYNLRYSEVITEVLERIFEDQRKNDRFVPILLKQIAGMRERQRTAAAILRLLSDRLRCSFLLLDRSGRERGLATWPMGLSQNLVDSFRDHADNRIPLLGAFTYHNKTYEIKMLTFDAESQKGMRLYVMGEQGLIKESALAQALEVLQTSYGLWKDELQKEETDDLVRLILNEQNCDIYRIANTLHIDLKLLRVMWILKFRNQDSLLSDDVFIQQKQRVKEYLHENRKTAIVDAFDKSVVAFTDDAKYLELDETLAVDFMEKFRVEYPDALLIWCGGLDSIMETRRTYILMEECCATACIIYPHTDILTARELSFAQTCYAITHGDTAEHERQLSVLTPLYGQKDEEALLETLTAYLLDSDKNTAHAAELLHVHESTIKYRLNKINRRLGYDITKMPAVYHLYLALAIKRLIDHQKQQSEG